MVCNIFNQDKYIISSGMCDLFLTEYIWYDPITYEPILKQTINTAVDNLRIGSGFTLKTIDNDDANEILKVNKSGIKKFDAGLRTNEDEPPPDKPDDWVPPMKYTDSDMFNDFDID